jgi:hypothetical protein
LSKKPLNNIITNFKFERKRGKEIRITGNDSQILGGYMIEERRWVTRGLKQGGRPRTNHKKKY